MEEEFKKLETENTWDKRFQSLIEKSRRHSCETAEKPSNQPLNRYLDVLPYEKSRVRLNRTKDNDYINANLVTVPKAARQYILTQGPLPETIGHFWLMVWEQKSAVIVMLNRCVEMDSFVKSEQYWPDRIGGKLKLPDVQLTVTMKEVKEEKHFTMRTLDLHDEESQKSRTVLQFQYKAWPDHGQPDSPISLLRLLTAIRQSGGLDKMDEPTVVHCSAGIGRSGTFCLIDSVLSMVENQGSIEGIDIENTLLEMRDYRMGLIQSTIQLRFAYMCTLYGIKILEQANKLHPHLSSITAIDNSRLNGSNSQNNGKKPRRNRRKPSNTNSSNALNIFNKHMLVEAMDDIDSDTADGLFEGAMKHLPSLKKARSQEPENFNNDLLKQLEQLTKASTYPVSQATDSIDKQVSLDTKAQMLSKAIESLLPESSNSQNNDTSLNSLTTQNADSALLRRRERDLRNQRIAEKTLDIKNKMKAEELKKERYEHNVAFLKKSALYGGVAIVLSSIAYMYLHGSH